MRSTGNPLRRSLERRLRERRAELEDRLAGLTRAPERGSGISFGKRVGDGTTEAVSRLNDVGVVDSLKASVERVERTLAKLAEGTYGTCKTYDVASTAVFFLGLAEGIGPFVAKATGLDSGLGPSALPRRAPLRWIVSAAVTVAAVTALVVIDKAKHRAPAT